MPAATARAAAERLGPAAIDWQILTGKNFAGADTAYASETHLRFAVGTPDGCRAWSILAKRRSGRIDRGRVERVDEDGGCSAAVERGRRAGARPLPIGVMTLQASYARRLRLCSRGPCRRCSTGCNCAIGPEDLERRYDCIAGAALFIEPPGNSTTDKARLLPCRRLAALSRRLAEAASLRGGCRGAAASPFTTSISRSAPLRRRARPKRNWCALADLCRPQGHAWPRLVRDCGTVRRDGCEGNRTRSTIGCSSAPVWRGSDKILLRPAMVSAGRAPNLAGHEKTVAAAFVGKPLTLLARTTSRITKVTLATLARLYREGRLGARARPTTAEYLALTASGSRFGDHRHWAPLAAFVDTIRAWAMPANARRAHIAPRAKPTTTLLARFRRHAEDNPAAVLAYATPPGSDPVMVDAQRRTDREDNVGAKRLSCRRRLSASSLIPRH
ncbi:hypothetical protein F2981_32740 (plasmid) [Sinorhizobium meliloti]|nr:hypothetical protein [Sinorhizobium meliloti]